MTTLPDDTSPSLDTQTILYRPPRTKLPRGWNWLLILGVLAALLLSCGLCMGLTLLLRPLPVTIVVNGQAFPAETRAQTVRDLLAERGLALNAADLVLPALDTRLEADLVVQITRARPVTLLLDGEMRVITTPLSQPADILQSLDIFLLPSDRLVIDGTEVTSDQLAEWPVPVTHISLRRALSLQVSDETGTQTLQTTAATVGEALYEAGIAVYLADLVVPDLDTPLTPDLTVTIQRARPVTIIADGERLQTRAQGTTVADALASAGVALVGEDYSIPDETQPLIGGMSIRIIRVEETQIVEESELPFETVWQADPALEIDQQRVVQTGQTGIERRTIRIRLENGTEVEREEVTLETIVEQRDHIIAYGTQVVVRSIDTPQGPRQYWRVLRMYATSYHPAALGGDDVTATGQRLVTGIIASDPRILPYGSEVYVEGYGVGLMADTGGPRRFPLWIDLGYSDADFRPWSRYVQVYVLTPVPDTIDYLLP